MTLDLRLAIPAACGWIAAGIVIGLPGGELPALLVLWLLAGGLILISAARRESWFAIAALAAAAAALCCTSIAIHAPERQPAALVAAAGTGRSVTAVATVTQTVLPGRGSFDVELSLVALGDQQVTGSIPVLVFGEGPATRLGIGSRVELKGTLTAATPGDDRAFLLFADAAPEIVAPPPWYLDWANGLRAGFLASTQNLPAPGGELLSGLAIGDTSAVTDELDAAMKASSLSHLTAVSGANCAIVIGLIMLAGSVLGVPRTGRIVASVGVLVAFVILVTPEPSVLRAAVMAALVLSALLGGRPVRGVPVLALATLSLLVLDPWLARNYGFVLSVLATGGLLLLAGPLSRALGRWMPRPLAMVVAVPLAAQLACQPVIILLNASVPTYGVIANVLAEPAAPVATVVGLAACVALAVVPPLGEVLVRVAWLPSSWIAGVARFFGNAPGAQLPWPGGPLGVALMVAVSGLVVMAVLARGTLRRWMALALAITLVGYAGLTVGSRVAEVIGRPGNWQIAACDVGQGDAVLVRSAGQVALIDTGPDPALLRACLSDLGIQRIDLLVLTHFDLDHVGGVGAVVGMVDRAFVGPNDRVEADQLVTDLVAGRAIVEQVSRGPSGLLGELRWQVLWPPKRLAGLELGNDASVTIGFQPVGACVDGCLSSIFLGDLGESAQQRLLAANPLGPVDVVKVSHHGSADQSAALYERLQAVVGVIGVGVDNGYGHPTERLLDILASVGTVAARTDRSGLILLAPGGAPGTVSVWTER